MDTFSFLNIDTLPTEAELLPTLVTKPDVLDALEPPHDEDRAQETYAQVCVIA